MVVHARLMWVRRMVIAGCPLHISISAALESGRGKVKLLVKHGAPPVAPTVREVLISQLDHLARVLHNYCAVDRGHRHSASNVSEVSIWLTSRRALPTQSTGNSGNGPSGSQDDGQDDSQQPPSRRGRSPPSQPDPWQHPGADPWVGGSAWKAPRTQAPQTDSCHLWSRWAGLATSTANSSITPDPPFLRTSHTTWRRSDTHPSVDPWSFLAGMAIVEGEQHHATVVQARPAHSATAHDLAEISPAGTSLLNAMIERRAVIRTEIEHVKDQILSAMADELDGINALLTTETGVVVSEAVPIPSKRAWEVGDLLFFRGRLSQVGRLGYGAYSSEIRIFPPGGSLSRDGEWVYIEHPHVCCSSRDGEDFRTSHACRCCASEQWMTIFQKYQPGYSL